MNGSEVVAILNEKNLQRCLEPHRPQHAYATEHKQCLVDGDNALLMLYHRTQRLAVQIGCIVRLVKRHDFVHHLLGKRRGKIQREHG